MSFDLTFNIFKETPIEFDEQGQQLEKKNYLIGFFAGQNNLCNTVIFAAAITSSARKVDYEVLIDTFVSLMGKPPQTIISDQDTALISCLESMRNEGKYNIGHLYDSWHFIKSLKFKSKYISEAKRQLFALINA